MEDKYKKLLEVHRLKFVQLVEVERLYPILNGGADGLSPNDISEIDKQPNKAAKVEKLLDILPLKGTVAFQSLCLALETTYPHLLTVMFLGSNQRVAADPRTVMAESEDDNLRGPILQDSSSQEFRARWKPGAVISTVQYEPHSETFPNMTDHLNPQSNLDIQSGYPRLGKETMSKPEQSKNYEWLRSQCEHAINELQSMKQQYAETMKRCDQAVKEADHYRSQYKSLLMKHSKVTDEKKAAESQKLEFSSMKQNLEHEVLRLQQLREEDKREMEEIRKQQRKVVKSSGSNEVLNEMYDTAIERYDTLKREYDVLRERCDQTSAAETSVENRMETLTEEICKCKDRCDELTNENSAIITERDAIKQQCTAAIRNWNLALRENKSLEESQVLAQRQRDDLLIEINQSLAKQLGMKKEVDSIVYDRDSAQKEYQLVMSERDVVHKEMEQLLEKVKIAEDKVAIFEKDKREMECEVETLRREIQSALQERDKANKERNEIYGRKYELEHERDEFWKEFDSMARERDIAKKERHDALEHIDTIIKETYEKSQKEKAEEINNASKETEILRKQMEKMKQDLSDSFSEADIAKKRRDWAFSERDKIVQERESIRTLCDNLRRDRDRAVSALAQALRDSDELKKQKTEASKELKDLKEKYEVIVEKETRKTQLNSIGHNHSRDSAIDADLLEWEMETLDVDLQCEEGEDYGIELLGGKDEQQFTNDPSIFISHITKGSPADGKLKLNDLLVKINNTDVTNTEKRVAVRALHKLSGRLSMVVRRRKCTSARIWQPLQLLLSCQKESGIHIEQGLFISRVYPGGVIGKDGMLPSTGDRIVHINSISADSLTAREAMKILDKSTEPVQLDIWRQASPVSSAGSSPTPNSQSVMSSLAEHPISASKMSKSDTLPLQSSQWDTSLDSSRSAGSNKNIRTSGSQTDSLDSKSPGPTRRHKERNPDHERSRHSVHVIGKAFEKIFRTKHGHERASDSDEKLMKKGLSKSRNENVIAEFGPVYEKDEQKEAKRKRSREAEQESNSGTWPKTRGQHMMNVSGAATVIMPFGQKRTKDRPSIKNIQFDPIPNHHLNSSLPSAKEVSFSDLQNSSMSSEQSVSKYMNMPLDFLTEAPPPYMGSHQSPPTVQNTKDKTLPYGGVSDRIYSKSHQSGMYGDSFSPYTDRAVRRRPGSAPNKHHQNNRHSAIPSHHMNAPHLRDIRPVSAEVTSPLRIGDIPSDRHSASTNFVENSSIPSSNRMIIRPTSFHPTSSTPTHNGNGQVWSPPSNNYYRPSSHHHHHHAPTCISPRFEFDLTPAFDRLSTPSPSQHSSVTFDRTTTPTPSEDYQYKTHSMLPFGARPISDIEYSSSHPTFPKRGPLALERIRIPSNTSVATKSGSVEIVSDRSSASSPLFGFRQEGSSVLKYPNSQEDFHTHRKPHLREIRTIHIEKTAEPVGFQIQPGPEGGIFVSSVSDNSLASDAGIVVGDQLLEVCGINMRNATYDHAVTVLRQCGNNLTMKVDFNPDKYRDHPESSSNGSLSSVPHSSGFSSPLSDNELSPSTRTSHRKNKSSFGSVDSAYERLRRVCIERTSGGESPGFNIVGGNATGIFVHDIQIDSIPDPPQGLQQGDHILEYNSVDFRSVTAEQASAELSRPCSVMRLLVHFNLIKYNKILNVPGDSFYIRANFERLADVETELSFHKDDILLVENTLYQGNTGLWFAWLVDNEAKKLRGGTIPSRIRLEDDMVLRRSLSENFSLHDCEGSRRGSGTARRSFFRRRRHHRNNSKDSREFNSFSDASLNSDSVPILDDSLFGYTKIEKQESNMIRPVVVLAPLSDAVINKLIAESPDKYCQCQPVLMSSSAMSMEQNLSRGHYIDYWKQDDQYECIRVSDIKDICDKKMHCLLNVGVEAIERLQRLKIYPIVLFVHHKSPKQIREVRDVQFLPDKMTTKVAKELYDQNQKLEQENQHNFSCVIQGGNLAHMCMSIKTVISNEQKKTIWLTAGSV